MEKADFFSYSWNIDDEEKNKTIIRIYGIDSKGENTCVIVDNFLPYVYLELPDTIEWNHSRASLVTSKINSIMGDIKPVTYEFIFMKKLYFVKLDKEGKRKYFPFIKCSCSHTEDIKQLSYRTRKPLTIAGIGTVTLKIHEHNATPILQLTSVKKLPPAGWITFIGKRVSEGEKISYCKNEFKVSWKNLSEKSTNEVGRPLLMGYDIEVNSSIPSSMPNANRPNDKIFQISCVLGRQGLKPETYKKFLLSLGDVDIDMMEEETEVRLFDTETDLLLGFTEFIREFQPNIIIGYNIFGFDCPYMIERAKYNFCIYEYDRQGMNKYGHAKEKLIEWSSSAYKNQSFQFLDAEGRVFVDLLPLVKRDYKMSNYQLKTIASYFLKDMTKDPLDAKGIFKCYKIGMEGGDRGKKALAIVGKYCVKDSELVIRLFEVLTTWFGLTEMSKVTNVPIFQLYTQGQQLKVFSHAYKKCTHENIVLEKDGYVAKEDEHYVGATVFPPVAGVYENVIPFDFSSLYPSTIIAYNISWDTLVDDSSDDGKRIRDDSCHVMEWDDHQGCQHDPKEIRKKQLNEQIKKGELEIKEIRHERDLKKNKDRKSEFNLKIEKIKTSLKPFREERSQIQKSKPKHIICAKRRFRWLKSPMGVLPEILSHLLETRAMTKKEMKKVKSQLKEMKEDSDEYRELSTYHDVLDQRQLALKVSANSGYGCTGVKRGYMPLMPAAMCTTYMGRKAIEKAAESIQKDWGGVLVYGDTDSNYINFPHLKKANECWDHSVKVAKEVSGLFPKPMSLAFEEKIYAKFMILTKKRYMSLACEKDGVLDTKISKKGVLLNRRDNCEFVRRVYSEVVMSIFYKRDIEYIVNYILEELNKLCSRVYETKDFVITKSIGEIGELTPIQSVDKNNKPCFKIGDYKVKILPLEEASREKQFKLKNCNSEKEYYLKSLPAQAQLSEKMRSRGQLVAAGSRIEYVITTNGGYTAKQYEKVEHYEYFCKHSSVLSIDYLYYLKQLSNPLDQILDIMYIDKCDHNNKKWKKEFMLSQYQIRLRKAKVICQIQNLNKPKIRFEK